MQLHIFRHLHRDETQYVVVYHVHDRNMLVPGSNIFLLYTAASAVGTCHLGKGITSGEGTNDCL